MPEIWMNRRTPACSAASANSTAAPRSTVSLRPAPLPGPAPAANTATSAPLSRAATSPAEADSRSQSTPDWPVAARSGRCAVLRTRPVPVWPVPASCLSSLSAICPWPPAITMCMLTILPRSRSTDSAGPELDADSRSGRACGLGNGVQPTALAATAHHQEVAVADLEPQDGTALGRFELESAGSAHREDRDHGVLGAPAPDGVAVPRHAVAAVAVETEPRGAE